MSARDFEPDGNPGPHISVVIPVYNRERYLAEAIESVLQQETDFPFEIIVSDDASTDKSVAVAKSYGENVKVLTAARNQGAASARNAAIRGSNAPYIAFLDSDDRMLPGRLQVQVDFLEAHPEVGQVNAAALHESGEPAEQYYGERGLDIPWGKWTVLDNPRLPLIKAFYGAPSTTTLRRSLIDQIGLFDESIISIEDWELFFRAASVTKVGCYAMPLVWMRTTHAGRYGPAPRGAIGAPGVYKRLLASTNDLTAEERRALEDRHRRSVRPALSAAMHSYGGARIRSILADHGLALDRSARLKWLAISVVPRPMARLAARMKAVVSPSYE
jgi:glycosyltransferase involved in cell wall biosynthesis